jgi:benzoyl-CoA reductase/2-hydroxyglutaryl-CoA dehydratase subunit BcrC/BadD/HgdB
MNRKDYLLKQKQLGRRVFGVFPAQYPREILWAASVLPVEIWDPPLPASAADAHLQPYICSVVKLGLGLLLQGKADMVDGFLFPHTCDSIQNMASVVHDYIGLDKPCYFFYHPKAPYRDSARDYYLRQIKALAQSLEEIYGPINPDELRHRVKQGQTINKLMSQLYQRRAAGVLHLDNSQFYQAIRRAEWLWPDDLISELNDILAHAPIDPDRRPAVVISGVLPNPPELLNFLDDLGARVGHDDFLACSRRWLTKAVEADDPYESLSLAYFGLPPCSSKDSPLAERSAWLLDLCQQTRAKGLIFYTVKFCETELFDIPILSDELKKSGYPTLIIDTELNQGLSGQITTRVEAFLEMLG